MEKRYGPCFLLLLGSASLMYYLICLDVSGWDTSGLWVWPLFSILCFLSGAAFLAGRRKEAGNYAKASARLSRLLWRGMTVLFAVFFLFEAGVVYGMNQHGREGLDYVLILGGGVVGTEPSPALKIRIETALDYLEKHPKTKAVASGGLGSGDNLSEGACIAKELMLAGIAPERIQVEERSATTAENMRFSREFMEEGAGVGIVTSNFHVFRSMLTAKKAGFTDVTGIAAPFGGWMLPHYMVREFMTFTVDVFRGNIF